MSRHQQRALPTSLSGTLRPAGSLITPGQDVWLGVTGLGLSPSYQPAVGLWKTQRHPAASLNPPSTALKDLYRAAKQRQFGLGAVCSGREKNDSGPMGRSENTRNVVEEWGRTSVRVISVTLCPDGHILGQSPILSLILGLQCGSRIQTHLKRCIRA